LHVQIGCQTRYQTTGADQEPFHNKLLKQE
jgi:hypothetical protein